MKNHQCGLASGDMALASAVESCGGSVGLFRTMANAAATLAGTRFGAPRCGGGEQASFLPTGSRLPTIDDFARSAFDEH